MFAAVSLLIVGGVGGALWFTGVFHGSGKFNGPTATVERKPLKVTIVARGSLEAAKNADIICVVKSGSKGSTFATTIKWLIDAGTEVKAGEKLMELDSSGFEYSLQDQKIKADQARTLWDTAEASYDIQESQNKSDINAQLNILNLAEIDLQKYINGDFIQAQKDVEGKIEMAISNLETFKVVASYSAMMAKNGFKTALQVEADQAKVAGAMFELQTLQEQQRVLENFMKPRTIKDLSFKLEDARSQLERVKFQAEVKLKQLDSERINKHSIYEQELWRKKDIENMIEKCTIRAPQDGLVVYFIPDQAKGGGGSQQSIVAQGEPVRDGQKLLQIPDLSKMQVNVRVPEALVSHLHSEDTDEETPIQTAQIKIDAYPTRTFSGKLKFVDSVASQGDWFASDVKFYKTIVTINEQMDGLKDRKSVV